MDLSIKQERFCVEYAKTGNARQAYIKAGYKARDDKADASASRMLKNVKVKNRLAELAEDAKNDSIADIQEMQEKLTSIIRQEAVEEVIMTEGTGEGCSRTVTKEKKPSVDNVIKAINTLGKMQGAFVDRMQLDIAVPVFSGEDDLEE